MLMKFLWRQFVEIGYFFFIPFFAVILPWRIAWRWLHWWAQRNGGPFDEAARAAVAVASKYLPIPDEKTFVKRTRLIWLTDYADFLRSIFSRRRSWYPWYVKRVGAWPSKGPFIAAGFHHGACYWLFRTLAEAGHDCTVISIRWDREEYREHPMRYWYGRLRYWDMERIAHRPIAYRPGIKPILDRTLVEGSTVLSLVDLPPRTAPRGRRRVRLLDHDLNFAEGIVAIAREAGAPIVPFWCEFDSDLYTRRFCIGAPLDASDIDATIQALANILDRQIRSLPEGWMFWPEMPRWVADARAAAPSEVPIFPAP